MKNPGSLGRHSQSRTVSDPKSKPMALRKTGKKNGDNFVPDGRERGGTRGTPRAPEKTEIPGKLVKVTPAGFSDQSPRKTPGLRQEELGGN